MYLILFIVGLFVKDVSALSRMEIDAQVLEQPVNLSSSSIDGIVTETIKEYLDNAFILRTNPIVFNLGRINLQLGSSDLRTVIISSLRNSGTLDVVGNNVTVSGSPPYLNFDFAVAEAEFLSDNTTLQVFYDNLAYNYTHYMRVVAANTRLTGRAEYRADLQSPLEIVDSDIITGNIQANIYLYGRDMEYTLIDDGYNLAGEIEYLRRLYVMEMNYIINNQLQ